MIRQAMQLLECALHHANERKGTLLRFEATVPSLEGFEWAVHDAMTVFGVDVAFELRESPGCPQVVSVDVGPSDVGQKDGQSSGGSAGLATI